MFLTRLLRERRASAAVEFALIGPLLIVLYFGAAELTQGYLADRRAAHAASALGDLVAQSSSVTPSQVSDYFAAGDAIVAPFPTTPLAQRVSGVSIDANGNATIAWSQASGMSVLATGSSVSLPAGVGGANQGLVMSESQYVFTSNIGMFFKTPITLSSAYYFTPRNSSQVTCPSC